jgi:hypothetical protein
MYAYVSKCKNDKIKEKKTLKKISLLIIKKKLKQHNRKFQLKMSDDVSKHFLKEERDSSDQKL